jgi:3-(3-hydroxy-phenyl)propionate hydroxylase
VQSYDVVVVGCGPVGAVLAARLTAAGLDVLVVERAREVHPLPRAVAADDEVQELLSRGAPDAMDGAVLDVPVRFLGARGSTSGRCAPARGRAAPGWRCSTSRRWRRGCGAADGGVEVRGTVAWPRTRRGVGCS